MAKLPIVLRIFKGDQLQGVKQFTVAQIVIGRSGEVQVALDGEQVSTIHAAIEERGSDYFICDLGSENGTLKNGEPVLDAQIVSGDVIQIGNYRLEFFVGAPKPKSIDETTAPSIDVAKLNSNARPSAPVAPVNPPPAVTGEAKTAAKSEKITPAQASPVEQLRSTMSASALGFPLAGPGTSASPRAKSASRPAFAAKGKKSRKTFAPASRYSSVKDLVKPTKGTIVEVLVAWRERIIATHHFKFQGTVTMGSHPDCNIVLPIFSSRSRKVPILRIGTQATVLVTPEMTGELIRGQSSMTFVELLRQNRMNKDGAAYTIALDQGEMVRVDLNDQISLVIRYVSDSPKPLVAPLLDLSTSEATGVVLSFVLVAVLGLYMFLYSPPKSLADDGDEEPMRTATVILTPPPPAPKVVEPEPTPPATPPPVTRATPTPDKQKVKAAVSQTKAVTNLTSKNDPGKSANAAPNKNKTGPRQLTSPKQGGAIKTTDKEGSQMKSRNRDVSKSGVFSVFGSGGANNKINEVTNGAGELAGLANGATGKSGYSENRPGQGLGSDVKDTGRGGTGNALTGIAGGVGTTGRGSGNSGYGQGGLGNRQGVKIVTGGADEQVGAGIDREAIRRVILANLRVIRTCYERELNRNPDLFGKLVLGWDIGEGGRVLAVRVKSNELNNAAVASCIMDRLKTWKFPDPPANQVVEVGGYPFFFSN